MQRLTGIRLGAAGGLLLFLLCGLSHAETANNPSATGGLVEKAAAPAKPATSVFVNRWPGFSLSYPSDWHEIAAVKPNSVLRASGPRGLPVLGVYVLHLMNVPLESAARLYARDLAKTCKDVKLLHDDETRLKDGTPAREAAFEWTDGKTGMGQGGLFVTTKKEDTWVVASIVGVKGGIDANLRKIVYSLEFAPEAKTGHSYRYRIPDQTDDGWQTADASVAGLDKKELNELGQKILGDTYPGIHGLLIVKGGKLVFEEYFSGWDMGSRVSKAFTRNALHGAMSVTKSFTSTLIGIAIDKGMIKGTDEDLLAFFPEYEKELKADNKGAIKLRDVLSMSAGFDWDETATDYTDPRNPVIRMYRANDIIGYLFARPIKDPPGQTFAYNTGLSTLLGTIIERRSGLKFNAFARKYLFGPLGISTYELPYIDKAGKMPASGAGLLIRPRDMAKLGYLFLRKGDWKGKQIVSAEWVEEATREHVKVAPQILTGYGYQWWLDKFEIGGRTIEGYAALGYGGQGIYVFPALDAVIVFTAGNYTHAVGIPISLSMLHSYILPAMIKPE